MEKAPTRDLGVPKDPRATQGQEGHVVVILCITLRCRLSAKQVGSYPSNHQLHFLAAYPGFAKRLAFNVERGWVAAGKSFMGPPTLSCLCVRQVTPSWKKCWLKVSGPHWRAGQGATPVQMLPAVIQLDERLRPWQDLSTSSVPTGSIPHRAACSGLCAGLCGTGTGWPCGDREGFLQILWLSQPTDLFYV